MKLGAALGGSCLVLVLATAACRREERAPAPAPPPAPLMAPLAAPAAAYRLPVAGFGDAVLSVPAGITGPAPVLVAVLGIGDTPESQCATWRELVGTRAFVLCPRGLPHFVREETQGAQAPEGAEPSELAESEPSPDSGKLTQVGFYPSDVATLEREVEAGLASLRAKLGTYVSPRAPVYAGFSRGAFLGASLVAKEHYPRAVLIEGGQSAWTDESAADLARNGGKRVLFACGRPSCLTESEAAAALLAKHGIETRIIYGEGEGHGYKRQVKDQLRASFDWVTEGEPLWRELVAGTPKPVAQQ
jgi:predicted esterase